MRWQGAGCRDSRRIDERNGGNTSFWSGECLSTMERACAGLPGLRGCPSGWGRNVRGYISKGTRVRSRHLETQNIYNYKECAGRNSAVASRTSSWVSDKTCSTSSRTETEANVCELVVTICLHHHPRNDEINIILSRRLPPCIADSASHMKIILKPSLAIGS